MDIQILNEKRIKLLKYVIENKDKIFYKSSEYIEAETITQYLFELLIYPTLQIKCYNKTVWMDELITYTYISIDNISFCINIENNVRTTEHMLCVQLYNILKALIEEQNRIDDFDMDGSIEEIMADADFEMNFRLDNVLKKIKIG